MTAVSRFVKTCLKLWVKPPPHTHPRWWSRKYSDYTNQDVPHVCHCWNTTSVIWPGRVGEARECLCLRAYASVCYVCTQSRAFRVCSWKLVGLWQVWEKKKKRHGSHLPLRPLPTLRPQPLYGTGISVGRPCPPAAPLPPPLSRPAG